MDTESIKRSKIIETTTTPLAFFTLAILIVEALLGYLATKAEGTDFTLLLMSMIVLVFALIAVVLFTAIKHPEALTVGNSSTTFDVEVRLVFDEEPADIAEAVAYYQRLPEQLSENNKLIVNPEEANEAYVIVPGIRANDRIKIWLNHKEKWYASENVTAGYRRLKFFVQNEIPNIESPA